MVKNKYFIIFCCLFMFFCSCAQEPEVLYKNGVKTVEESRQITSSFSNAEFPQHVVFSCVSEDENNTLAMDADLVLSEQEIFSGTVEGIKAEKSKIKDVFFEDGEINETYIDSEKVYFLKKNENSKEEIFKDKTLSVDEMGMFQRYYYNNPQLDYYNSLNAEFIEYKDLSVVEKEEIDKIVDTVITSMKSFNPTMVVDHVDIGKTFNGFSLNIQFVDEILGLKCVDISSSFSLYDSGWAICSKEGINSLNITAGFKVTEKSEIYLANWDMILDHIVQYINDRTILRPEGSEAITRIELRYMLKNENNAIKFFPVWCFYSTGIGSTTLADPPLQIIFCINAQNGELEYYNGF